MSAPSDTPPPNPQLVMRRSDLDDLPPVELPAGYSIRTSREGDGEHWGRILTESFGNDAFDANYYERAMIGDPSYRPDRIFFVCAPDGVPCGTAGAYQREGFGPSTGYLHFVAVRPAHTGRRLGSAVSLAALHKHREDGMLRAVLQTDDFRLAAITVYLRLGFEPLHAHESHAPRWDAVFAKLGPA